MLVAQLNLSTILYLALNQPAKRIFARRLEFFNESVLTIINLHMFMYTKWIPD